jgi:hypothetical protein
MSQGKQFVGYSSRSPRARLQRYCSIETIRFHQLLVEKVSSAAPMSRNPICFGLVRIAYSSTGSRQLRQRQRNKVVPPVGPRLSETMPESYFRDTGALLDHLHAGSDPSHSGLESAKLLRGGSSAPLSFILAAVAGPEKLPNIFVAITWHHSQLESTHVRHGLSPRDLIRKKADEGQTYGYRKIQMFAKRTFPEPCRCHSQHSCSMTARASPNTRLIYSG